LGKSQTISRTEVYFEFPTKVYAYKIEYSTDNSNWYIYADKSNSLVSGSPIMDKKQVETRYIRLTITKGEPSVWKFKIF
jgi:hypothetical protein